MTLLKVCGFDPAIIGCHTFSYCLPPGARCQSCEKGLYQRPRPTLTLHETTAIIPLKPEVYRLLRGSFNQQEMNFLERYIHITNNDAAPNRLIRPTATVSPLSQETPAEPPNSNRLLMLLRRFYSVSSAPSPRLPRGLFHDINSG